MRLPRILIGGYRPLARPTFEASETLYQRQLKAAAKLPPNSIKPLLVESQPDSFVTPAEVPEDVYPPIG